MTPSIESIFRYGQNLNAKFCKATRDNGKIIYGKATAIHKGFAVIVRKNRPYRVIANTMTGCDIKEVDQ